MDERKSRLRNHEAMLVLSVPDVVVRERVDVHVQVTIVVHVDVRNEEMYTTPSVPPPLEGLLAPLRVVSYAGHRSPPVSYTN